MPYRSINELPESVKHVLPKHAQDIYKEVFNRAYQEYQHSEDRRDGADREEVAHRVAWTAVKHKYQKGDDGLWHPKK